MNKYAKTIVLGLLAGMLAWPVAVAVLSRVSPKPTEPATFTEWLVRHEQTCPQCGGPADNGPPAICEEAFEVMKDFARKGKL